MPLCRVFSPLLPINVFLVPLPFTKAFFNSKDIRCSLTIIPLNTYVPFNHTTMILCSLKPPRGLRQTDHVQLEQLSFLLKNLFQVSVTF